MSITLVPFSAEHLDPAATLLAARHRSDRGSAPDLPARYEDPAATAEVLHALVADDTMSGVAALRGGQLVGYLLGAPALGAPTGAFAGVVRPRSADVPYVGWAGDRTESGTLYQLMYAALAERWVADGLLAHYISLPVHSAATEPWLDLGFGRYVATAVTDTASVAGTRPGSGFDLEIRRAEPDDAASIQLLAAELFRAWNDSPVFVPYLPETAAALGQFMTDLLADEACPHWLAFADGQLVGMQVYTEPVSPHWNLSPLQSPEGAVYLFLASTAPEVRGRGVGAALFAAGMAWAQSAGYERCALHYLTASRAAAFWRGLDFRPVTHWQCRVVDQRRTWTRGRS